MHLFERYSPGRLAVTAVVTVLGLYLFGFLGPAPTGPVAAFFITITALYFAWAWLGPLVDERLLFPARRELLRGLREATQFSDELRRTLQKRGKKMTAEARAAIEGAADALDKAIAAREVAGLARALQDAERSAEANLGSGRKGVLRDFFETIGGALLVALLLRVFVVEAFKIPSGSMIPSLEIGDHIFVNKFSYGLAVPTLRGQLRLLEFAPPTPGDVIVFIAPEPAENAGEDFIKRVVAGPGQTVRMVDGTVYVDDVPQPHSRGDAYSYAERVEELGVVQRFHATRYRERTNGVEHDILLTYLEGNSWPPRGKEAHGLTCSERECRVQPGYVFCMGDNRDNSSDSRRWGAVPIANVKGKAMFVWLSFANTPDRAGPLGIRWERLGTWIR